MFQRGDGHLGMRLQEFCKEGGMQAGKPGGLFEGMLRCRDHQKEQRAGAHPLQPLTDGNVTCDPRVQGASEHGASPRYESSDMDGGDDSTGKRSRCPDLCVKDVICGIPKMTSFTQDRKSTRLNSSHDQISYAVFC